MNDKKNNPKEKAAKLTKENTDVQVDYAARAKKIRQQRAKMLILKLGLFVLLPTLIAAIYYSLFASKVYQSESSFSVQGFSGISAKNKEVANGAVKKFILSRDVLKQLNSSNKFTSHYSDKKIDYFSRLKSSSFEAAFEYYTNITRVDLGMESKVITLKTKAFSAKVARDLNSQIIKIIEQKLITLSNDAVKKRTAIAQHNLKKAEKRMIEAATNLASEKNRAKETQLDSGNLETAVIKNELAKKYYETALNALKKTELSASQNIRFMTVIANPSLPDSARFPKTGIKTLTVFLFSMGLFIILSLLVAAIREHAKL